jgi:putative transposase
VLFLDMKSSMPLGFEIMPTENHICVASALRRSIMLLKFKPRILYFDNGRAFKNKIFNKQPVNTGELPGLFARLNIEVMNAESYHGQSKTIEPWWRNIAELERMMSSYSGINIDNKPAYLMRNEKLHKSVHERLTDGLAPSMEEVYQFFISFFRSWEQRPHQSGVYAGRTPAEIFNESMEIVSAQPDFESRQIQPRELDLLMLNETMRTTQRERIRLFGREYEHPNLYGLRKKLVVKYDFLNHSEILVYTQDNELVCVAKRVDVVHPAARLIGSHNDVLKLESELENKRTNMALTTAQYREYANGESYVSQRRLETQIQPAINMLPKAQPVDDQEEQLLIEQKNKALQLAAGTSNAARKNTPSPSIWSDMGEDASPEDYIINREAQ